MKYNIIGGVLQQHYHTIPQDIDMIKTSPSREAIFKYLAQIGYKKFPEFIADILVKVDGHTLIDITDGPGDEKRDIYTEKGGKKYLIQCKHTINFKNISRGDDLDLLFSACIRKDCLEGLFITNTDLTPQAKRFIHDKEYSRGWRGSHDDRPIIDYWNDSKIWNKISTNSDILNKWFSGLGQVHGIRNFKFDLTFQKMPYNENTESKTIDELFELLTSHDGITVLEKDLLYEARIDDNFKVFIKRWFQFPESLRINFISPTDNLNFLNRPYYSFSVEVQVMQVIDKFSVSDIHNSITKYFGNKILTHIGKDSWWHIISSQPKSFIYLHDIGEPREIELAEAKTYVKVDNYKCTNELDYCLLNNKRYNRETTQDDQQDDLIWTDQESGIQIILMFEQKMHPMDVFNYQVQQFQNIGQLKSHTFRVVTKVDNRMMMRVRKLLHVKWFALYSEKQELFWTYPPNVDENLVLKHEKKIESLGLKILHVKPVDIDKILNNIINDINPAIWHTNSTMNSLSVPISLEKRIFWLSKDIKIKKPFTEAVLENLIKYKFTYENEYGFDNLQGDESLTLHSGEIKETLFDLFTFRGKRMLDIATHNTPLSINLRFREHILNPSDDITTFYLQEFSEAYEDISLILKDIV